ncbi:MAP7 domain-containing protein 1-like [Penaeus vannamei]|uniref:MAP7 domain-containing protein 1-like n=1 Tax=Penaeus vannamei TaxID=6689 RepID=UPI00387FAFBC
MQEHENVNQEQGTTSELKPRTSELKPRTSELKPRTSEHKPRTSELKPRTSELKPRTEHNSRTRELWRILRIRISPICEAEPRPGYGEARPLPTNVDSINVSVSTDATELLSPYPPRCPATAVTSGRQFLPGERGEPAVQWASRELSVLNQSGLGISHREAAGGDVHEEALLQVPEVGYSISDEGVVEAGQIQLLIREAESPSQEQEKQKAQARSRRSRKPKPSAGEAESPSQEQEKQKARAKKQEKQRAQARSRRSREPKPGAGEAESPSQEQEKQKAQARSRQPTTGGAQPIVPAAGRSARRACSNGATLLLIDNPNTGRVI